MKANAWRAFFGLPKLRMMMKMLGTWSCVELVHSFIIFCTAKQHKTALSFLVFRVIAAHVNPISTPQHTRYRGPHKRALSMQRSVANPPTDSLALQRETPVAHIYTHTHVGPHSSTQIPTRDRVRRCAVCTRSVGSIDSQRTST